MHPAFTDSQNGWGRKGILEFLLSNPLAQAFLASSCQNSSAWLWEWFLQKCASAPSYSSTYTCGKVSSTGMKYVHRNLSKEHMWFLKSPANTISVGVNLAALQEIKEKPMQYGKTWEGEDSVSFWIQTTFSGFLTASCYWVSDSVTSLCWGIATLEGSYQHLWCKAEDGKSPFNYEMHIQPEHTWNVYILRKTIQLSHSISRADWQGNFSLIKNFDETGMSALVHAALTGTGSSLNQVPHDVFRGKEENVSWNLSRDLACILEHISCYENCWNTFKWASHNCPWELSCQLEVTQAEPPKVEKPEIGRGGWGRGK